MNRFRTAIASYSFHGLQGEGKCDVFNYLNMLKYRYNVKNADIWTGFLPTLEEDFIAKVKDELDRKELILANLCVDGPHVWVDDPEKREAHRQQMLSYIKAAHTLGAQTIRIDFGGTEGHTMPEEAFEYIVKTYQEYCKICGGLGMKIGPENHWGWDRVPEYLEKVKDAVASPYYGHLYHLRNFYDEPERGEAIAISYAMHTHIHAGSMPYAKEVIRKLAVNGYTGVYSAEHHSGKLECERVEWQIATVRGLIAELREEGLDEEAKPAYFNGIYNG
ncbi:MAG: sugar phosphate isomerase/epimerase [Ruminococcaceae bacterium]|nr:sugar phosphate isomerase/epimerase [Oscillospiraceae bacterium]